MGNCNFLTFDNEIETDNGYRIYHTQGRQPGSHKLLRIEATPFLWIPLDNN